MAPGLSEKSKKWLVARRNEHQRYQVCRVEFQQEQKRGGVLKPSNVSQIECMQDDHTSSCPMRTRCALPFRPVRPQRRKSQLPDFDRCDKTTLTLRGGFDHEVSGETHCIVSCERQLQFTTLQKGCWKRRDHTPPLFVFLALAMTSGCEQKNLGEAEGRERLHGSETRGASDVRERLNQP